MEQEPTPMAAPQVGDDIGETIKQGQIDSLNRELKQYSEALEAKKKDKEDYTRQAETAKKIRAIQAAHFRKVPEHIQWEFEKVPEYWELQDKILADKHRQENHMDESTLKRYELEIEEISKRLADTQDALDKLTAQ